MFKGLWIGLAMLCISNTGWAQWQALAQGLSVGTFPTTKAADLTPGELIIVKIDPQRYELMVIGKSWGGVDENLTAREWGEKFKMDAVINAGMFDIDYHTHIGYLKSRGHTNAKFSNKYQSLMAFDPKDATKDPPFRLYDLDEKGASIKGIEADYHSVIQNLRLIKRPGENRWEPSLKAWSEAALAEDAQGNILFIFTRSRYTMHAFNAELLALDLGIVAAQHLEGGPEAQLYVNAGKKVIEKYGRSKTDLSDPKEDGLPWPIPNVIGVRIKAQPQGAPPSSAPPLDGADSTR